MSMPKRIRESWLIRSYVGWHRFVFRFDLLPEERARLVNDMTARAALKDADSRMQNNIVLRKMHDELRRRRPGHLGLWVQRQDVLPDLLDAVASWQLVAFEDEPAPPPMRYVELLPPAEPESPAPEIRSWIGVKLVDSGGKPIPSRQYRLVKPDRGAAEGTLDAQGSVVVTGLDTGQCRVTFETESSAGAAGPLARAAQAVAELAIVATPATGTQGATAATVTRINARLPGTRGVRKATDVRPSDQLTSSSSNVSSLAENAPIILVRGCNKVELEAVTNPPRQAVQWEVVQNENTEKPPTITPKEDGRMAELSTAVHGSFSVIARLGNSRVIWNVVFVWVQVLEETSRITIQNEYEDQGAHPVYTKFRSGIFLPRLFTWDAKVKVAVIGGGRSRTIGATKVNVCVIQNGVADTLTGHYSPPPGTATEVPAGGLPVLDSINSDVPYITGSSVVRVTPDQRSRIREVWTADSPGGAFPKSHQYFPDKTLTSVSGGTRFVTAIASTSDDATHSFIIHATIDWAVDFDGIVTDGRYKKGAARTTSADQFKRVSNATGGQDAYSAGIETFEPRFSSELKLKWSPMELQ